VSWTTPHSKALLEFIGFARHGDEPAGGLLTRERGGGSLDGEWRFNNIGCPNAIHR